MAYKDFREFIEALRKNDELIEINDEVDWDQEAGAIVRRSNEMRDRAVWMKNIKDYPGRSLFGAPLSTFKRVAIAMEMDPNSAYADLVEEFIRRKKNPIKPILVSDGPCKENIMTGKDVDLFKFPAPMVHDGDGGRYFCTWHINITKDPDSDWVNWGMYRAMIHTENTLGGLVEPFQHIGVMYSKYTEKGKPMEVAISIGPDPICTFCATVFFPPWVNEVDMAGAIRKEPVELVKCETMDIMVPATSEIVLECTIDPDERKLEGPFGEFTGYRASPAIPRPVYRVKAITYRNNPIATMSCMGMALDDSGANMSVTLGAMILEELRDNRGFPIKAVRTYGEAAGFLTAIATEVPYANIVQQIANVTWGSRAGAGSYYLIITDSDVNVNNWDEVFHALATRCNPRIDITVQPNFPGHALVPFINLHDRKYGKGASVLFDATWPKDWDLHTEIPQKSSFETIYHPKVKEKVLKNWEKWGFSPKRYRTT